MDLSEFLDGSFQITEPDLMPRSDGLCLLYTGKIHSFHGESESGKSMILLWEATRLINQGESVLWMDMDSDPQEVISRLLSMGAEKESIRKYFDYRRPESPVAKKYLAFSQNVMAAICSQSYRMAVIDGVNDAINLFSGQTKGDPNDNFVEFSRRVIRRIADYTKAAVVVIDHVSKDKDNRGRFAIGAQAKMSQLTGAAYYVDVAEPFGREMTGEIRLFVAKDRPGGVRGKAGKAVKDRLQPVACVTVSNSDGITTLSIDEDLKAADPFENNADKAKRELDQLILTYIAEHGEHSTNELIAALGKRKTAVIASLKSLTEIGALRADERKRTSGGRPYLVYGVPADHSPEAADTPSG